MEKKDRLMSLDALRGADMFFIIGGGALIVALCQLFGFGKDCWLATQMTHVDWHGFRQHDTIFPLFLFLAGVSWPFSYAGQLARGRTTGQILRKIAIRVVVLCLFGTFGHALFTFDFAHVRYDSVLGHIGCCWGLAAVLFMFVKSVRARLTIAAGLLVAHWLVFLFFRAPDAANILASTNEHLLRYREYGTDNFSFYGNIAGWIDRTFMPGRLHEGVFDPEGLLCKVTGTVTAMLGMFAGELLRRKEIAGTRKTLVLAGAGALALVLCFAWQPWCPVNKKLWTPTFILAAASYSFFALALFYWIIDVKGFRRWAFFFQVIGMNAITIYMIRYFVRFGDIANYFLCGVAKIGGNPHWATVVSCAGTILAEWLLLWFLYRKNTFLRV